MAELRFGDRVEHPATGRTGYILGLIRDWSHPEQPGGWEHDVGAVPPVAGYRVRLDAGGEITAGLGELHRLPVCGICDP